MGGSFVPEPGLVGPPPSCTGTNSASNRDSHSESATTKEHRRFFVTSLKFTHGDNTWHLYTISFLMGKPQTDSSKKRQGQRVFCNLSHIPKKCSNSARQLIARGIKALFPIQQHSFYPIYNREDVIARDLTGSGKTLAFCLPTTEYLRKRGFLGQGKIQAMIMCPTRELAVQVS